MRRVSKQDSMENNARFTLKLLGTPFIECTSGTPPHPPRTLIWCLLEQLVGEPNGLTRKILREELQTDANSLRKAISNCNHADHPLFGTNIFAEQGKTLRLRPGLFHSDTVEFAQCIEAATADDDTQIKIALLKQALALVRGNFLDGLAKPTLNCDDWITAQQKDWNKKIAEASKTLIALYEEQKQGREAYEIVRRLDTLLPEDKEIATLLLHYYNRFGDLQPPQTGSRAEWIAFAQELMRRGATVTLSETKQFHLFFAAQWEGLEAHHSALERLCILEGSFDTEFAAAICEVTSAELSALANLALLIEHDGRFEMPPPMRQWISDTLPAAQKVEMQAAYHEWIRFTFVCEISAYQPPPPELFNRWQRNAHHLEIVLNALLDSPIPEPAAMNQIWFDFCPPCTRYFFPDRMQDAYHFLAGLLDETPNAYRIAASANVGWLMFLMRQYEAAAQHYHEIRDSWREKAEQKILCDHNFLHYTNSLHHGGKVEKAAELLEAYLPLIDPDGSPHFLQDTLNSYAVSLLALGRFEAAYAVSGRDIALRRQYPGRSLASPLYHQGMALAGLKRYTEALASFDEALELFKQDYVPHGEADCLQQMGKIHAERGQVNTGKRLIEDALRIYEQIPQMQSRAACLRSLGDVLKIKGDLEGAKAAYCEGLAFWENEVAEGCGGSGWVQRFRERLGQ